MKITYLGTGAAEGIPALFCNCEYCRGVRQRGGREIRTRAQVLIDGELSIDFPPDAFAHAQKFDASALKYLLVTHSHMDHFYAHDFILRGYKYASNLTQPVLHIYGNGEVMSVFGECTAREMKPSVKENLELHPIGAFEELLFGKYRIYTLLAKHSSEEPLLFLIEKEGKRVLHLSDTGRLPDDTVEYLSEIGGAPVDLITLDCTFLYGATGEDARHMGLDENMRTVGRLEALGLADAHTKKVITHFSHNARPTQDVLKSAEEAYGVIAAFDGMEIEL